ncbi:PAS domain-containing protein [Pseudomonas sp. BCRC 81390]|uniref:PAS domain-containing sensor histidine kinase n=1 Tax=Pseudomonas sp. BCRC 81390 TaxID=3054778 RepID=UPI002594561C|nr:PAS domain-containing sensor histidine kinase [Pseudomonas sp. BCRC 81390]MDM3886712.1 PAS domain-containing protein [Pseudomonas sp. BCRC 81390]
MQPDTFPSLAQLQARVAELEARLAEGDDTAQANNRLLGELLDNSRANVFAADRKLRLVAINRTARETFERYRGFVPQIGDYVPQFLVDQPDLMDRLAPVWPRVLAGEAFIDTITLGTADAPRHYEIRYHPWRDALQQIQGGYMFAFDITERVVEQERLRQTEDALRQAQKMEAVGQLTGGIAHDFNNLLGSLLGSLELARQRLGQQRLADATRLLELSHDNASRAAALVQHLLAFSRRQALLPQALDVHALVADMHDLVRSATGPHIDFQDHTLAAQWPIHVDPQQLENVLLNLCINARDAMPSGGTLRIASANTDLTAAEARRLDLPPGRYLHIRVEDSGMGMSDAVLQRALEPFFTTKPLGQGTGLGLAMAYGFARQSAGQLLIDSVAGEGTCVHLYFPQGRHTDSGANFAAVATHAQPESPQARRIMLVEDQPALRLVLVEVLTELGHEVRALEDGRQALEAMRQSPPPDLLVADIGLPEGTDGYQLAAVYQELVKDAPVLLITGYDIAGTLPMARLGGRIELLAKPFTLQSLGERINRLLEVDPQPR